jgi:hypothetical protein
MRLKIPKLLRILGIGELSIGKEEARKVAQAYAESSWNPVESSGGPIELLPYNISGIKYISLR